MTSNPSTPDSDGPKTETTLTTRIRINIPGSRPIPPVVVRKAMGADSGSADAAAAAPQPQPNAPSQSRPDEARLPARPKPQPTRIEAAPEPAAAAEEPASNWFAPRKTATPPPAPAPTPPQGALPTGAAPGPMGGPMGGPMSPPTSGHPSGPLPGRVPAPGPSPLPPTPAVPGAGFEAPPMTAASPMPDHRFGLGSIPGAPAPGLPSPGGPGVGTTQPLRAFGGGQGTPPAGPPAGPTAGPGFGTGPVVPPHAGEGPRWPGPELATPAPAGPVGRPVPGVAPEAERRAPTGPRPTPQPVRKKGRSRVVLLLGGVVSLLGVAYGAGLLLNHSDVPKGTTVLGVDISGSRDEAVAKLQTAFATRAASPLQLSVGGKQVELKPEKAGLSLDSQTTVRNAAGSDYNPVTVIGSLLGQERVAEPVMPVDEEKLQVALQELAATAGTATEGTITFDTGKAVAVPGTPGNTIDVDGSLARVTKAFHDLVATGEAAVRELPVTTKAPAIDQAELDRAMKEFAEPAMSANATVKVGGKALAFGSKSLPKILSMQAVDGHLVEKFDLDALKATYGNTYDGVLITRGTGEKTAVTPQDVAGALTKALRGKTTAERTVVIDTNAG